MIWGAALAAVLWWSALLPRWNPELFRSVTVAIPAGVQRVMAVLSIAAMIALLAQMVRARRDRLFDLLRRQVVGDVDRHHRHDVVDPSFDIGSEVRRDHLLAVARPQRGRAHRPSGRRGGL